MGRIAKLSEPLDIRQAIKMVKDHLSLDFVQLAEPQPDVRKPIKSVAVCAGSGGSVFKGVEADLLITGEMSHVRSYLITIYIYIYISRRFCFPLSADPTLARNSCVRSFWNHCHPHQPHKHRAPLPLPCVATVVTGRTE